MRKFLLRLIAISEIAGALCALTISIVQWVSSIGVISWGAVDPQVAAIASRGVFALYLMGLVELLVAGLNFFAGIGLWKLRPKGLKLSILAQAVLVPQIVSPALIYKFILGPAFIVFWHTKTFIVGSFLGIRLESIAGSGDAEPAIIGINMLAVATCIYLWWVLRHIDQESATISLPLPPDPSRRPLPARVARFVLKSFALLAAIVLIPVLAWWAWNRIDEKPTPQALRWFAPLPHTVRDADNAWLYLLGIGAARDDDPIVLGQRIVATHNAREAKLPREAPDEAEKTLRKGSLPFVSKGADGRTISAICSSKFGDCVQWALNQNSDFDELAKANAIRLNRYETALGLPHFEEFATLSTDDPIPDYADNKLFRLLILRDIGVPARRADALQRLTRAIAFWRRVDQEARVEVDKIIAESILDSYRSVLDAGIDRWGAAILDDPVYLDAVEQALHSPSAAQRDYELPLRGNALRFARAMSSVAPGTLDTLRYCKQDCLKDWLLAQAYAPQATRNLEAQFLDLEHEAYEVDPRGFDAVVHRISALGERSSPLPEKTSMRQSLHAMTYNFTGTTLVLMVQPAYAEFVNRRHDEEAHRRMFRIKVDALRQHIAPESMPAYLAAQPADLRDPYTGEPFAWNASFQELRFAPKAKIWKQSYLAVYYPTAAKVAVTPCKQPLLLLVHVKVGNKVKAQFEIPTCATGVRDATTFGESLIPQSDYVGNWPDITTASIARKDGKLDVRLAIVSEDMDRPRVFEIAGMPLDQHAVMRSLGPDTNMQVAVGAIPDASLSSLLHVDARNMPARRLATELAHAGHVSIRNLEAWPQTPATIQADGQILEGLLFQLAEQSRIKLHGSRAKGFAVEAIGPTIPAGPK